MDCTIVRHGRGGLAGLPQVHDGTFSSYVVHG